MFLRSSLLWILCLFNASSSFAENAHHPDILNHIKLPEGFRIDIFASEVPNIRSLTLGDHGVIYAGSRQEGRLYALQDKDGDGKADKTYILTPNLYMPNGVAYRDGSLYVAEVNRITRYDHMDKNPMQLPPAQVIYDQLPSKQHHGWKYLRFGPDGKLYTAVGAPCNVCDKDDKIFTSLIRMNPDGSDFEIIARGVRNTVGMDWEPETNALFFTENGRDYMGENRPPDELNQWKKAGEHFGYPYCHADIPDPRFGKGKNCRDYSAPAWLFDAHVAPLGMRFYRGKQFPKSYQNQLFVAEHGSWNRKQPIGYRIVRIGFKQGKPVSESIFADGWLTAEGKVLGRPTDILEMPDGSLLVSDDHAGLIYRITYPNAHVKP